jgi:hypothetical protein
LFVFGNVQQLLLAGIGEPYDHSTGKGTVGKSYAYQFEASANAFFENGEWNPFICNAGTSVCIDDFNGENFDHAGLVRLLRRRLYHRRPGRRTADHRPRHASRHAGVGFCMEARDRQMVSPLHTLQHARVRLCQP